ncbi:sodium-independent sulfate anion transporter-like isoform X2 [Halichondria panicea]|uniref:sodium-independent sulfate anion transporter-like isoform X2 n=1 Tax=Halichondria panicea TaxID=6063 RepID=UPI00312B453F
MALDKKRTEPSGYDCCCPSKCPLTLPHSKRPRSPVSDSQYELLQWFPCYFDATWLLKKFPFFNWLLRYRLRWLVSDVVAGLTVGLMVVPQALAYASIANLPHAYGLYSAFMGCFIYTLFGTSKDVTLGPTAIVSLLTESSTRGCGGIQARIVCATALTFLSGAIQFAVGILNLGFLVEFIPVPVISGFTSAAAITIALGQLHSLLGLKNVGRSVLSAIHDNFAYIAETKIWDLVLGVCCMLVVIGLKLLKSHMERIEKKHKDDLRWYQKVAFKFIWLICTARNAVVVFSAALIGYSLTLQPWFEKNNVITLITEDKSSLPNFTAPDITSQTCSTLSFSIVVVPLISFLESIAIVKAFARKNGYKVDSSQELVALGLSNLASSFVGSYPVTGSFSRTAVNAQSGVKTPAAGIVTGLVVILALAFLGPAFHYIPSSSLAAIIIVAVLPVVDVTIVWKILKTKYIDVLPLLISFTLTLFLGIQYGVLIAVAVYLVLLLYRHAKPRHQMWIEGSHIFMKFNGGWTFPGVEHIISRINAEVTLSKDNPERQRTRSVILDCTAMPEIDFTIIQELRGTCSDLEKERITVCVVSPQVHVGHILKKASISNLRLYDSMELAMKENAESDIDDMEARPLLDGERSSLNS